MNYINLRNENSTSKPVQLGSVEYFDDVYDRCVWISDVSACLPSAHLTAATVQCTE